MEKTIIRPIATQSRPQQKCVALRTSANGKNHTHAMEAVPFLIDDKIPTFVLTGNAARRLTNLLNVCYGRLTGNPRAYFAPGWLLTTWIDFFQSVPELQKAPWLILLGLQKFP